MHCSKCNTESKSKAMVCSNCGNDLTDSNFQSRMNESVRLLNQNQLKEAEELLSELYTESPLNPDIINNIGLLYLKNKNNDAARIWFRKALAIDNSHRIARKNLKATSLWRRYSFVTSLLVFVIVISIAYLSNQSDQSVASVSTSVNHNETSEQEQKLPFSPLIYMGLDNKHINYQVSQQGEDESSQLKAMSTYSDMSIGHFKGDPIPNPVEEDIFNELSDNSIVHVSRAYGLKNGSWGLPENVDVTSIQIPGDLYIGQSWKDGDDTYTALKIDSIKTYNGTYPDCLVVKNGDFYYYYYPHVGLVAMYHYSKSGEVDFFMTTWDVMSVPEGEHIKAPIQ